MIGCKHNINREFIYPGYYPTDVDEDFEFEGGTFHAGDEIILRCPLGCEDIHIMTVNSVSVQPTTFSGDNSYD